MEQVLYVLGELKGLLTGTNQRIDDLRTETHAMHRDLSGRITHLERASPSESSPPSKAKSRLSWLASHIPVDRIIWVMLSAASGLSWLKAPSGWIKYLLTGSW